MHDWYLIDRIGFLAALKTVSPDLYSRFRETERSVGVDSAAGGDTDKQVDERIARKEEAVKTTLEEIEEKKERIEESKKEREEKKAEEEKEAKEAKEEEKEKKEIEERARRETPGESEA